MNKNHVVWIVLVTLTLVSYAFSEGDIRIASVILIIALTFVKCFLVGFYFMELSKANWFWRVAFLSVMALFLGMVSIVVLTSSSL